VINSMRLLIAAIAAAAAVAMLAAPASADDQSLSAKNVTLPDGAVTQEGAKDANGKWTLPDGSPTFHLSMEDGKVSKLDWYAYSGFRRYHSECHVCHGPEGEGSSYAPALVNSLKTMSYGDFLGTVASGKFENRGGTDFVMPALGDNKNVMCYIDDIYIYLKARATGALPRGRPPGRDDKPQAAVDFDKGCNP
jgi:methanol metabolism-related c-type cytochrome